MANATDDLLSAFEGHDVAGVRAALLAGADPCSPVHGKPPIIWLLEHRTSLRSAFTSLTGVTLLHVAAEYCHLEAARALVEAGADVHARADVNEHELNGHTPLFHTVNSIRNRGEPVMRLLLAAGARTDVRLAGIRWGEGFEWDTTFFDVTPISYAQMGLLPQVHRNEREIYANLKCLLEASGRSVPELTNVPNRYLQPK